MENLEYRVLMIFGGGEQLDIVSKLSYQKAEERLMVLREIFPHTKMYITVRKS